MPRESKKNKLARATEICARMNDRYPREQCHLKYWNDPFKLTVAVMLSAQTTDKGVNKVTPILWEAYPTIEDLAGARIEDVEEILHPIGFFKTKAANAIKMAQMVLAEFGGQIPQDMKEIQRLPGVGRKTANVVLNEAFGIVEGIAVDTHVFRIAHELRFSNAKTPAETEMDLLRLLPKDLWGPVNHQWVVFGREVCVARRPKCSECFIADLCPSAGKH